MSQFQFTRPNSFPPIIKNLIIINVLVYVMQIVFEKQLGITELFALYPVDLPEFKPYQLVTHYWVQPAGNRSECPPLYQKSLWHENQPPHLPKGGLSKTRFLV